MRDLRLFLSIPLFLLLFWPSVSSGSECLICHGVMKGKMVNSKGVVVNVHIDTERFSESVHGVLGCTDCHVSYAGGPHETPISALDEDLAPIVPFISKKRKIDPVAEAACLRCHPKAYETFKESVHGKNMFEKGLADAPTCTDCHGTPHYIVHENNPESLVNHANVLHTCGRCHEEKEITKKYGFSEYVIEKYKESFHGKKYLLGHEKVPICNDCHGSHGITKWDAPDSPVIGEGKVKTCGRCHEGATGKFAAAPAHKYIGKDNPIPYYGEKLLIMLLLGTFAFIVSHVLLEAYSEIRDYLFRKNEGGSHE